jgi:hypothetical protein
MLTQNNFTLQECFMQDTRDFILQNARWLNIRLNPRDKKALLAKKFADVILQQPLVLLRRLPYGDVLKLQKMVHDRNHAVPHRFGLAWDSLTRIGLTDHIKNGDDHYEFIYPDLVAALMPVIDDYVDRLDPRSEKVRNEEIVLGLLNLYGILSYEKLEDLCYSLDPGLTSEKLKQVIEGSFLLSSRHIRLEGEQHGYSSPFLFEPEYILKEIKYRHFADEPRFSLKDVLAAAGTETPQPPKNEMSNAVNQLLHSLVDPEDENWWLSYIWMLVNNDRDPMQIIKQMLDGKVSSLDQINSYFSTFTGWINDLPRWIMKGNSSRTVYEKYEKPQLQQQPPEIVLGPNARKAGLSVSQEQVNKIWKDHGRKIGRNDPCPCGSGKKYKHCCGRHGGHFFPSNN